MADKTLTLEIGQHRERRLKRTFARSVHTAHEAQVDHMQRFEAQIPEIVVNRLLQLRRRHGRIPRGIRAAATAHLGDDHEILRIGMQRFADQPIGDVRPIEVAGVNVVDPARHRLAQHGDRLVVILGRTKNARPRELHRPITHAAHGAVAKSIGAGAGDIGHIGTPRLYPPYGPTGRKR